MEGLNLVGSAVVAAWLFSGFYAADFMESRASRENIPAKLFPYLTLAALVLGPLMLIFALLWKKLSGVLAKWLRSRFKDRDRVDFRIIDSKGREMYGEDSGAEEAAAVTELKKLLGEALKLQADGIFIDPRGGVRQLRLRVADALRPAGELSAERGGELVNVIKLLSGMEVSEKQRPQDGSFSISGDFGQLSLQVAAVGARGGEKLSIRVLAALKTGPMTLEETGLDASQLELVRGALGLSSGLVLVCGPSGSGRTATLYALLGAVDQRTKNVVSIEESITHVLDDVTQMEVNLQVGLSFPKLIDGALPQDPDIIFIDGIYDAETARSALHAAQTGHLVVAVADGGSAAGAVGKLASFGIRPNDLAGVLRMIVSQRLVRKLCSCSEPDTPPPELAEYFGAAGLPTDGCRRPGSCRKCDGTGYAGFRAIFEIVAMNDQLRAVFEEKGATVESVRAGIGSVYGGVMAYEGYKLAAFGLTSIEEAGNVALSMENPD